MATLTASTPLHQEVPTVVSNSEKELVIKWLAPTKVHFSRYRVKYEVTSTSSHRKRHEIQAFVDQPYFSVPNLQSSSHYIFNIDAEILLPELFGPVYVPVTPPVTVTSLAQCECELHFTTIMQV